MNYYDVELIDQSENIANFKFHKIKKDDLDKLLEHFKKSEPFLEFSSEEGNIVMKTAPIRGVMFQEYEEKEKTVMQENMEAAEEISKVKLKKTVFNTTGDAKNA